MKYSSWLIAFIDVCKGENVIIDKTAVKPYNELCTLNKTHLPGVNMKSSIRIISALLLLFVLFSFAACGTNTEGVSRSADITDTTADANTFYGYALDESVNYGGETVKVITTAVQQTETCYGINPNSNPLYVSETASAVVSAQAKCISIVEERLGLKVEEEMIYTFNRYGGEMYQRIYKDVTTGTVDYLFAMPCLIEAGMLALDGFLHPLNDILDLDNPWWAKAFNNTVTIAGKTYFAVGDIGITSKDSTQFVAFNKQMVESQHLAEKYGRKSLYEMVDNHEWTQDVMFEMAREVYRDTNQNNKPDLGDVFGIAGQSGIIHWLLCAGNERICTKDSDGYPILTLNNERAVSLITKAQENLQNPATGYMNADDYFNMSSIPVENVVVPEFKADRCLFFVNALLNLPLIRDMKSDFGVLPLPLYDKEQENYSSNCGAWVASCIVIPSSVLGADLEKAKNVLECLGAVSRQELNPVYYEQTLQYQVARDDDSARMLDIIFANRAPELGEIYRWGNMHELVTSMLTAQPGTFVSSYQTREEKTKYDIEETVKKLKNQ